MSKKLLRKKLALMLSTLKKKRKFFCEVEYLKASEQQYIDTGIMGKSGVRASVGFEWDTSDIGQDKYILAAADGYYGRCYFGTYQSKWMYGYSGYWQYGTPAANTRYDAEVSWELGNQYMKINGETLHTGTSTSPLNTTWTMYMFARNQGGPGWYSSAKIYYCKMWENDVLVRDFIPVLDWDMKPAMYDKVSGELFYNLRQGVSDFTYGREIHYVEYLESTGTQYIDTGFPFKSSTDEIEMHYTVAVATSGFTWGFGSLESGASYGMSIVDGSSSSQSRFSFNGTTSNLPLSDQMGSVHKLTINSDGIYNDGELKRPSYSYIIDGTWNNYLFALSYRADGTASYFCRIKIYNYQHKRNGVLVRDFIPAIDENGVGFMFDRVTHTIFDNAGTGVFSYPARETEYTANAATLAYIDLGVKYKPSMTIEGKYTRNSYGTQGSVILLSTTTTAPLIYLPALSGTSTERFVWRRVGYTEQNYIINNIQYPFTAEIKIDAVKDTLTVNNEIVKTGMIAGMNGYDEPYESYSNMYIFSIVGSYAGDGNVSYLKITDGTTPLFDLIPAYKDGEAGFYNKVDGTFHKNASTHSNAKLTAGKIIEPEYEY